MTDDAEPTAELRRVVERYAATADGRDPDGFADVFTPDALLITPRGERRGRDELADVPRLLEKYDETRHRVTAFEVTDRNGDHATASTWCTAEHLTIGDVCMEVYEMTIRYDDRFERTEDGWRIAERRLVVLDEVRRQA